jgi:hypothetical protein
MTTRKEICRACLKRAIERPIPNRIALGWNDVQISLANDCINEGTCWRSRPDHPTCRYKLEILMLSQEPTK